MPPVSRIPVQAMLYDAIKNGNYPFWFPEEAKPYIDEQGRQHPGLALDYFAYGTDFTPLTASLTLNRSIQINSDSAFMILSATMVETATDNTTFLSNHPILVTLGTGGAALQLSNTPIHADNWFGSAEEPKYWDIPKVLLPNTTFNISLQNLEAVDRNVRVAFHGFKLFQFTK